MDDDLGARADDYERRLAASGSTEGIIRGLVRGAERSRRTLRWLIASVIFDITATFVFGFLGWKAYDNAHRIEANQRETARIVRQQQVTRYKGCLAGVLFIHNQNEAWRRLAAIDENTPAPTPLGKDIQAQRIAVYKSLIYLPEPTVAGCGPDPAPSARPGSLARNASLKGAVLAVGGKEFTEQRILCNITILALRSAGATVDDKCGLPGSDATRAALTSGQISMYWEYTGTAWISFLKKPAPIPGAGPQYQAVKKADTANHIVWLDPAPFNDTYAIAVKAETAKQLGVSSLSDLAALTRTDPTKATMCVNSEFAARDDGLPGMEKKYGFTIPRQNVSQVALSAIPNTIARGDSCVFGDVASTDGKLKSLNLITLVDDRVFFPAYNPAPNVRASVLTAYPNIAKVLNPVAGALDVGTIIDLNFQVDVGGKDPGQVAQAWLRSEGFIG
jgi:osmoprotectant transport system substrate-binding protein